MRVLALDSTTRAGSVALLDVDVAGAARVVDERLGDAARTHAERLPADLMSVLDAHDLSPGAIDLFAVASGPGSFTGLRIGIATMQGLALATGRPLLGVSALDALADAAGAHARESAVAGVWMDAYRREVFTGLYRLEGSRETGGNQPVELEGPRVASPAETLMRWSSATERPSLFVGGGAVLYRDVIAAHFPAVRVVDAPALASSIGRIAARRAASGMLPHPAALQPLYVRRPDAEIARDNAARVE